MRMESIQTSAISILSNQIAVVTGAGSGIGRAIALRLAHEGALVYLVDIDIEALGAVRKKCDSAFRNLIPYYANLERDEEIHALASHLRGNHGVVDLLVHSAGVVAVGEVLTAKIEDFDWQFRVNVRAPYLLTQVLLPLIRTRSGQIVFINSSAGLHASAGSSGYAAIKHALKPLADSLRNEVNRDGIRVLSVYRGRMATPTQEKIFQAEGRAYIAEKLLQPEDVAETVMGAIKLPAAAELTDLHVRSAQKWD